jgi:hypothetical protein
MVERDMEDLIATYPGDFFPRHQLTLKGRQQSFAGIGRFDLLFEDEFQSAILMELKARTAKYEDATQVARYRDELKRQGHKNVIMWVVATQLPTSVKDFLEDKGIEYAEIHLSEFRRIAEKHKYSIQSEAEPDGLVVPPLATKVGSRHSASRDHRENTHAERSLKLEIGPKVTSYSSFRWKQIKFNLSLENPEDFNQQRFLAFINAFEHAVPSKRNAKLVASLRLWAADPSHAAISQNSLQSLLRWVITSGWQTAVPHAEAIWVYLFGKPVPDWYQWNPEHRRYEFDAPAWGVWFASINARS